MEYKVKVKIGNVELFSTADESMPYVSNVQLKSSTSLSSMGIGATASDALYFTMYNPYKVSFDGEKVVFYISPSADTSLVKQGDIQREIGTGSSAEVIDNSVTALVDDSEAGTPLTPEELAAIIAEQEAETEQLHTFLEGEAVAIPSVTTEEEEEDEWIKIGAYYVFSQTNSSHDNTIRFECLDALAKLNDKFTPTRRTATVQQHYNDLKAQITANYGLAVDDYEFDAVTNVSITWDVYSTYREAFGYLAGMVGGYASVGADEILGITFYTYNSTILLDDALLKYAETSAGEMIIGGFRCDRAVNPYKEDVIEVGAGQTIGFFNPFVTAPMLEQISNMYYGMRFTGAELSVLWNEHIQSGQFMRLMSAEEYANYLELRNALKIAASSDVIDIKDRMNNLGTVVLVSNQTISFAGEAVSAISSICKSEFAKGNKALSPTDAAFKNLYAEMIQADWIDANQIVTKGLTAESLEAKAGVITDLVTENLEVGSINGNVIKDGSIIAKALSNEAVTTLSGIKLYYAPEEPVVTVQADGSYTDESGHVMRSGDTWYQTVVDSDNTVDALYIWSGSEWSESEYDGSIIRANSITAQEIATNTITANNIAGNSLTIGNMDSSVMASRGERGQMEWSDNALHIISQNEGKTEKYETEIGGDGIKFKYQDQTVASIDQDQLVIDKTLVFTEMKIGNWSWAVNPLNGNLIVKWGGR